MSSATTSIASGSPSDLAVARRRATVRDWPASLWAGILLLGALAVFALLAPVFGSPTHQDIGGGLTADGSPLAIGSSGHPLGTDELGRDMLARVAHGARTSLLVALVANGASLVLAIAVGVLAGVRAGATQMVLMRLTDVMLSVPYVLAALVMAAVLSGGLARVIVIITVLFWAYPARLVYDEVLRLRTRGFVEAAQAAGSPTGVTIRRHVLPHLIPLIVTYFPLNAAASIGFEAALSYLGAGINPPTPSWGNMVLEGQQAIGYAPQLLLAPSFALALTVLAFLLVGEGLKSRDRSVSRASWLGV